MIVTGSKDVIQLSGALHKNQWLTIKAAARLQLREHPGGILIDCSELTEVSEEGTKTFLDAVKDIQGEGARIVFINLPDNVLQVVRSVPGVRSQLPIAKSAEEARASLRMGRPADAAPDRPLAENSILVPLFDGFDIDYAVTVAGRASRELKQPVSLASLLIIPRSLPLAAPMLDEEAAAVSLLDRAEQAARRQSISYGRHVERVRDAEEGLLHLIKKYKASNVVIGAYADHIRDEEFLSMVDALLHRAPCNVLIARQAPDQDHPLE